MPDLDDRKASILRAIVRDYVRDGEPVGSKRLVEEWNLGVSAATVRAEMAALEDAGFIVQPHTSAGRIPTDRGYRYFVDTLNGSSDLTAEQRAALEGLLLGSSDLEDLLRKTSGVLSRLTHFAAMVVAPQMDHSRLRHIELVTLSARSVLAVLITDTGRVEKRLLELDGPLADHDVQRARFALNDAASGLVVNQVPAVIAGVSVGAPPELRGLLDAVADGVREGLTGASYGQQVFYGGRANIAGPGYFDRLEQVKQVYEALEEQVVVLQMIRETLAAGDPGVRIGAELSLEELATCAIVAARYTGPGESTGSVGVLGPTRMDYPATLATVQAVAESLERALGQLASGDDRDR